MDDQKFDNVHWHPLHGESSREELRKRLVVRNTTPEIKMILQSIKLTKIHSLSAIRSERITPMERSGKCDNKLSLILE